ncbi:uncharacterized protein LOC18994515 [Eutrema salsugineum]|uniref:uncharacterized protein LOC18994515 n=1 Tax=Eutrema salsugineum TaxID=72664 RepID=UPI000CED0D77|nr:uncharacterized protein LOC18994515 [Eutrema salsugineum]
MVAKANDAVSRDLDVDKIPFRPSLEAKLKELVHNICLHEIKLCSAAAKEFVKLLKGETGGNLLRLYFHNSPNFAELLEAWKLRHDRKQGPSYIFKLIHTILSHPEGKGGSIAIETAIDRFSRLLFRQRLDDIYKALNSNEGKQVKAALLLLASIVRRGRGIASEVAGKFDNFKGLAKLGAYKTQGSRKLNIKHYSTRKAFVAFAISFLEVGLLGFVFRQKEMYSIVLQGLGTDSEDTVASVLSTLKDKILVKESSSLPPPPPRRISVLFGIKTLKQLASISVREDGGIVNELAHDVLLQVCTEPCYGLMPDANRNLGGDPRRLLELMKSLRATEYCYHLDLLLAIVRGRPYFASAFLDEFPYNVENLASPSWVSSISLAANLVSSVRTSCSFGFLSPDQPPSAGSDVETIMKCICPRPFRRSLFTKRMLHSDILVKHGTLRFLLETLRLLDSFVSAWKLCSSHSCSAEQIQTSLERDFMGEVRSFFPDFEVLKQSLGGTTELSCKRKAVLDSESEGRKKRFKNDVLEEDIVIGGVTCDKDLFLAEDAVMTDQADAEKEFLGIVSEIWGSEFCSKPIDSLEEAEMFFQIKLLEVLRIYVRSVPNGLEGSFKFFMDLLISSSIKTVGDRLFKQWDIVRISLSHFKGVSIGFSPLTVCILQSCVRLLNSESKAYSLPEKSEISLYVCSTMKYLLQTQVDFRPLSCLVQSVLSEVVDGSKDCLCEWRPLRMLLLFSQSLSEKKPFISHPTRTVSLLADTCFADTLDEIKGLVRSISPDQDEFAGVVKAFTSALVCATPESILENFDSVMAVSWDLHGTSFSFLHSISFLDENFLGNLLKLSPDLFSEVTSESRNLREGTVDCEIDFADHSSSITEEIKSKTDFFLEQMPFPALLDAVMRMDISCLVEFPRISELLLLKVLQPKSDSIDSDIRLILNWLSQIRSSYKAQPAPVLCHLSEICLRLMKHLLSQISTSDKLLAPFAKWKHHQVAQTVLCHPVMMSLLESPLDCGTLPRLQNVDIFSETSLISEIDQHILDLLVSNCEHFLFVERHIVANNSIMAIKDLVERLLLVFKGKFEITCVGSQSYAPLLQPSQLIHALLRFISPVKLFYLARSMLSKTELSSPNSSMVLSLGLDIAGGAFEMLMLYSHEPAAKRRVYDLLWELEENNYDSNLIEEVYSVACKFSTSLGLVSADNYLLKVVGAIFRAKHSVNPLTLIISKITGRTPKDLIIHCINQANMTRAKIVFYLVESSPLHMSVFGHFFFSKQQDEIGLTNDQFIMLLPAVLSYLASLTAKLEKPCRRCLDITSVYSNILINGFLQWPKFLSECIFEEKYEEILPSATTEDIDTMFNASLLGKAVRMLQYHFALTESPTKTEDLLKIFDFMLDYETKEVDVQSVDDMFNVAIRVVAKAEISRICLFPEDSSSMFHLGTCVKESCPEMGSNRESLLLNALVNSWQSAVKRSDASFKRNSEDKCWFLCNSLENFILTSILRFLRDVCERLVHLDSLPFLERLMESVLLYRFEDSKTLKMLREILSLLSRGKYSYAPYLQLLRSHSQFTPTISSLSSHTGDSFRPVSSILKHLIIIPSPNSVGAGSCCLQAPDYVKQLEIVKILRVLLSKCGKDSGINLKEVHFLLLSSYGATMSEIDLELYKLMHDIELIDEENRVNVSETDYLWGKAALKMREGLLASYGGEADSVEDIRQSLFKENLCVDPKICAQTVLYFPYQHTAEVSDNSSYLYNDDPMSKQICSRVIERYDPAFILQFSEHSLYTGYIEPVEFASLGLLAVAFVSMSSADLGMRKLGYNTLGRFVEALECCTMNEHVKNRLGLLLSYVQNGVEEQWQRIPTVYTVFAAETSLILLDSSHEHHVPIVKFLKTSSTLKLRGIPLFHDFFLSSAVGSQRLWILRLVCVGLKSEDDAQIYVRNSVLEIVMSFFSTPLADDETKGLILEVVRKSVKFHKLARHLVVNCHLLPWCSSFISMFTRKPIGDEYSPFLVVLEVITNALASRNVTEWLQRFALEGLMEISSRLYRLLGGGLVSIRENGTCVDLILQILSPTLKMSQKREMHQPHFTITIEGIFQIFEAVANCGSPQCEANAERGLDTILMSSPPLDIICMDVGKLRRFLLWGTSTALKIDLKKGSKPSESHQDSKTRTEEGQEETMVAKFLRWLLVSVILGKLYSEAHDSDSTVLSEKKPETLLTLLENYKIRNLGDSMTKSEHVIGEVILHLQKLVCTNYRVFLPTVVFALSLMFLHNGLGDYKLIKSLCSRISIPPEAWRWSYHQAWKDLSSEPATDVEKMDVLHACQDLLLIFSDMLEETPQEVLLRESFDMSRIFEWERGLVET